MGKSKESESGKGEINSENTQIVMGKFSSSLRIKTLLIFLAALVIPFVVVICVIHLGLPSMYKKYENDLAKDQVRNFLKSVQDGIANIRVKHKKLSFTCTKFYAHLFLNVYLGWADSGPVHGICCGRCRPL